MMAYLGGGGMRILSSGLAGAKVVVRPGLKNNKNKRTVGTA
jgi:hypothetical protein